VYVKKAIVLILIVVGCVCLALVIFVGQNKSWQSKYEQQATEDFYMNQNAYEGLLASWIKVYPNRCGGPAPAPGLVTDQSISTFGDGAYSLDVNGQTASKLSPAEMATRLGVPALEVSSVTESLAALKSPEIIQSGAAVKIISARNDTHGVLHVDPSCSDAASYESWSTMSGSAGPYQRLKALGGGWYYYVEER
jgi:hypothetical protein